ncbi:DUF4174 domain-containing protein [Gracilimonas sp.]|uniref:DUF4174 domain-containing protein n=1 Tax=Gracilimonas sp. TaxID=1974203 RepID=UPI0032ED8711
MYHSVYFLMLILFSLGITNIHAQDFENFDLNDYKWENRILIVFSPNTFNADYQNQSNELQKAESGVKERDLEVFYALKQSSASAKGQILPEAVTQNLRAQFNVSPSDFTTILIGKDGTEKLRSDESLSTKKLFEEIDSMPMRKLEMKNDGG